MSLVDSVDTFVSINGDDISEFCNAHEWNLTQDTEDVTTYSKRRRVHRAVMGAGTSSIGGFYDSDDSAGPRAVIEPLVRTETGTFKDGVALIRRPEGTGAGKPQDSVTVIVTSYVESSPVAGMVTWTAELLMSGDITTTTQS